MNGHRALYFGLTKACGWVTVPLALVGASEGSPPDKNMTWLAVEFKARVNIEIVSHDIAVLRHFWFWTGYH